MRVIIYLTLVFTFVTGQDSTLASIDDPDVGGLDLMSGSEIGDTSPGIGPLNPDSGTGTNSATTKTIFFKDQCTFDIADSHSSQYHYDLTPLTRPNGEGKDDYLKEIQVGPNIQFIYRMNICADTANVCQNEPSPATESLKIPAGETCRILGRRVDESDPIAANHGTYSLVQSLNSDTSKNPSQQDLVVTYNNGDLW